MKAETTPETQSAVALTSITAVPFWPPLDDVNKRANWAQVREVDFELRGRELWFYFSRWSDFISIPDQSALNNLIDDLCNVGYNWDHNAPSYPKDGYSCSSPLSLMNDRTSYIIYKLSDRNWQFVRVGRPITVGAKGMNKKAYFNGVRVFKGAADKDSGTDFNANPPQPRDGSKIAYFIADATEAGKNEPNNHYDHAINLHVDLIFEAKPPLPTTPPTPRYFMPLVIDPDIRYPGGSQP